LGTEPPTRRRRGAGNPFDKEVAAGLIAKLEDAFILLPIFAPSTSRVYMRSRNRLTSEAFASIGIAG